MASLRTNFGEQSDPAPDRGDNLQSGGLHKVMFRHCLQVVWGIRNFSNSSVLIFGVFWLVSSTRETCK